MQAEMLTGILLMCTVMCQNQKGPKERTLKVLSMLIYLLMDLSLDSHFKVSLTIKILAAYKVQAST
jgi:hypothetical protein